MRVNSYLSDGERTRQGHRRRLLFLYSLGFLGLLLIGAAWMVQYAPIFNVRKIVVEGNSRVKSEDILSVMRKLVLENTSGRFLGIERIFAWPNGKEKNLALLPAVSTLSVSKSFRTQSVHIEVTERKPVGVWCMMTTAPSSCWWFDSEGILFARALDGEGGLLKTRHDYSARPLGIGMSALPSQFMGNLLGIFEALRASGATPQEVKLGDLAKEEVEVLTHRGPRLYFSLRFPLGSAAQVVEQIFSSSRPPAGARLPDGQGFPPPQKLQYVDFRVENRVYYK